MSSRFSGGFLVVFSETMMLKARLALISFALVSVFAATSAAGGGPVKEPSSGNSSPLIAHKVEFRAAGLSRADLASGEGSSLSERYVRADYTVLMPLSESWFVRGGAGWGAFYFDFDGTDRFPDALHRISLSLGIGTKVSDKLTVLVSASPGIYSDLEDVSWDDFDVNGFAAAQWKWVENFELVAGARFAPHDKYPVLPVAGLKWRVNERWLVDAMYPRPAIVFKASDWLDLYAGMEIRGAIYRTSESFEGTTPGGRSLAGQWLDFSEQSAVLGAAFKVSRTAVIELEGGYVFRRKFDYDDAGYSEEAEEGALALQAGLNVKF